MTEIVNTETGEIETPMTKDEARTLTERIKAAATEVYHLLLQAHEGRAWSALGYGSWRAYAMAEFDMGQSRAYQVLNQARIIHELTSGGDSTIVEKLPNEGQARELARVEPERRPEVWAKATEATDGKPTAKAVREAATRPAARSPKPAAPEPTAEEKAKSAARARQSRVFQTAQSIYALLARLIEEGLEPDVITVLDNLRNHINQTIDQGDQK